MDKSKILEELKRINFITNYEVGGLVFENESKKENILFEQKVNNLFEPKKRVINEEDPQWKKDMMAYSDKGFQGITTYLKTNKPANTTFKESSDKTTVYLLYNTGQQLEFNKAKELKYSTDGDAKLNKVRKYGRWVWNGNTNKPEAYLTFGVSNEIALNFSKLLTNPTQTLVNKFDIEFTGLYNTLKDKGIPVKYGAAGKETTDPSKATIIYWNGWVINKDNKANGGWPIYFAGTDKKYYYFKFDGGKFKGDTKVTSKHFNTKIDLVSFGKGTNENITTELKKYSAQGVEYEKKKVEMSKKADQIYTDLVKAFDYDNDGVDNDYDATHEELASQTVNKIDSKEVLDLVNAKVKARGYYSDIAAWFKEEMSSIDPYEYDSIVKRLNSLGYKLQGASSLGYLAASTVGIPLTAIDRTVTAVQDKTNYANKQTAGAVAKYSEKQVKDMLKNQVSPGIDFIGQLLLNASRWYDDDEEIMEMAFSRIHSRERYNQLKTLMGQDPYKYVKSLITNTGITHGKSEGGKTQTPLSQTIDASYAVIQGTAKITNIQPKQAYEKYKAKDLPFTSENPTGTKQRFVGDPLFWKIFEGRVKDPYLKDGKGVVPDGYLWGQNPSLYPIPEPYPTEDIQALRVYANQGPSRQLNERNKNLTEQVSATKYNTNSPKQVDIFGNDAMAKLRKMEAWNSELANQEKYIPKYCTAPNKIKERRDYKVGPTETENAGPVSESIYKNSKIKFSEFILEDLNIIEDHSKKQMLEVSGEGDEVQFKKTEGSTDTTVTGKETVISMAAQCRDFGGLWVYGTQTGKPECFCRDKANPLLSGKVGTKENDSNVYINVALDNSKTQSYTDWSNPDTIKNTAKTVISTISTIAALFIPVAGPYIALVGGLVNFGISASQGNTQEAALYLLFDLIPALGTTFGIGAKLWQQCVRAILGNKILTVKQLRTVLTVMNASEAASTKIGQKLSIASQKGLVDPIVARAGKVLTKQVEGQLTSAVGADGITMKNLSKTVAKEVQIEKTLAKA